jgi:hypothetical protein
MQTDAVAPCGSLETLLRAEHAFAAQPQPVERFPTVATVAGSEDLGFTSGPWVYTARSAAVHGAGHFLTVWRIDARCRWQVEMDGGISHAAPERSETPLRAPGAVVAGMTLAFPGVPPALLTPEALRRACSDFQAVGSQNGLAAGLRTYALNAGFLLYVEGVPPMTLGPAGVHLEEHAITGHWRETRHGISSDSSLGYSVGELTNDTGRAGFDYVQLWQYDPKVANWGLRILLFAALHSVR